MAKHPRGMFDPGWDLSPGSLSSFLAVPSFHKPPLFVAFGEGDASPSPVKVRTGLARLEQSARGHGLGPAAGQNQGEHPGFGSHPHASAPRGGWEPPGRPPGSGESHEHLAHTAGTFPCPPRSTSSNSAPKKSAHTAPDKAPPRPLPQGHFSPADFLIRTLNAARAGRGQPGTGSGGQFLLAMFMFLR